jgi:deoxyadenosine/deoxycytidine kinase
MFASRHPQYDQYRPLIGGVFTIEGIIGVGKSTLGRSLEDHLNMIGLRAKFFPEYVNHELLEQYIGDMKKYAYAFQMIMLCKRIEIYREAERHAKKGGIALIDRSIIGDMTFARMQKDNGNFTQDEWEKYLSLMKSEIQLTPTASIYLRCTSQTSLDRVKLRGIVSEIGGYTTEYMEQLNAAYEKSIAECNNVRHVIIDWNNPLPIVDGKLLPTFIETVLSSLL